MIDDSHRNLLAQIAAMYYEQELTQNEIARQLGLSRVKVYRLLKQAKAEEVVQITINWPIERDLEIEKVFTERFGLKETLILKTGSSNHTPTLQLLGQLGSYYLEQVLTDGSTMTVCLGRSTYEVINAIRPGFQAKVRVAQAMGSMPFTMQELDSATLANRLAQKLGGEVLYLSSPFIADSPEAADVMRRQRDIERTLAAARQADVALLGIGNLDPAISGFVEAGFITSDELTALNATGAVGDMAGQIFTISGDLHTCDYNQRVIGITFDELCQIETTIAVAAGKDKAKAILGALRTCIIKILCTDDQTAKEILKLEQEQQ
jgi:DNA-binding transcriptional regulator LsrR (DeoR family)